MARAAGRGCEEMSVDCMNVRPGVEVASLSDVGCQRDNNEDSYLYWEPASDQEFQRKGRLAVIADGMGGHEGGQEASRLAVETVRAVYDQAAGDDPQAALVESLTAAHARIQDFAERHPVFQGMGTTCTAVVLRGRQLYFAHVGDSRLYLVRGARILRLTRDHSYVGRLVESGIVRAERGLALQEGDDLLLCTDGLWSVVTEEELETAVSGKPPAESCAALVKLARQRGAPDNVTLQVLRVAAESQP